MSRRNAIRRKGFYAAVIAALSYDQGAGRKPEYFENPAVGFVARSAASDPD